MAKHRLDKIVTRTGDKGTTRLADGRTVKKSHPRLHALGSVDELNAQLGMLRCTIESNEKLPLLLKEKLLSEVAALQQQMFNLGADLAMPGSGLISADDAEVCEGLIEEYNKNLPPLTEFVVPDGPKASVQAHICRTTCRRAERDLITLDEDEPLDKNLLIYINRLSDLLFIYCRVLAKASSHNENLWQSEATN